jgi:hypothetical protein
MLLINKWLEQIPISCNAIKVSSKDLSKQVQIATVEIEEAIDHVVNMIDSIVISIIQIATKLRTVLVQRSIIFYNSIPSIIITLITTWFSIKFKCLSALM